MLASALSAISAVLPRRDLTSLGTSNSKKVALALKPNKFFGTGDLARFRGYLAIEGSSDVSTAYKSLSGLLARLSRAMHATYTIRFSTARSQLAALALDGEDLDLEEERSARGNAPIPNIGKPRTAS